MKKLFLLVPFFILVTVVLVYWFGPSSVNPEQTNVPPTVTLSDQEIVFERQNDSTTVVSNFLADSSVSRDPQNSNLFYLGYTFSSAQNENVQPPYVITFDQVTGSFSVTILRPPFAQARRDAEMYLTQLLKIPESELCDLYYMVTVPGYVNEVLSGRDFRFSFCPGAVAL